MKKFDIIAVLLMLCMSATAALARGVPVNISAEANGSWCGVNIFNCSTWPTGKQTYDGVTFKIPSPNNAWFASVVNGGAGQVSVTIPVNVAHVSTVYTLMNTVFGSTQSDLLSITFTGSNGATWTYQLVGGTDIRDYNNDGYTNSIDCRIAGGPGQVGTVSAWNNGEGQRLDMQIYVLPSSFHGQSLASITITDNGNYDVQRSFIAALTVSTGLP
jgi:hypothetical protein